MVSEHVRMADGHLLHHRRHGRGLSRLLVESLGEECAGEKEISKLFDDFIATTALNGFLQLVSFVDDEVDHGGCRLFLIPRAAARPAKHSNQSLQPLSRW